jgi:hypothetical protein
MLANATKGPWPIETVPTSGGAGLCHKIGSFPAGPWKDEPTCACVYGDGLRIGIDDGLPRAVELLANARLIAAAPETIRLLVERVRELEEDAARESERLRAVASNGWRVAYASPGWCVFARNGASITGTAHPTYGAAIDAAIASTSQASTP